MNAIINSLQARIEKLDASILELQEQELKFWNNPARENCQAYLEIDKKLRAGHELQRLLRYAIRNLNEASELASRESLNV